jgi:hypothetical protein
MDRKLWLVFLCSAVLVVGLSACSSAKEASEPPSTPPPPSTPNKPVTVEEEPSPPPGPPVDVVTQIIQQALRTDGSVSYEDLVERLGRPQRVSSRPVSNAYQPDQTDTLRTLTYRGIEALVYDVSRSPKTFLIRFSLMNDRYASPEGLRVGDPRSRVLDVIGPPTRRNPGQNELIYSEDDSMPTAMIVTLTNDRIARIDWEFYFS